MTDELFTLTRPQRAAYTLLFDAPQYYRRPCKDDPKAWDNTTPTNNAAAVQACKGCPVLAQCRAVVDSGVQIDGVVAARVLGRPQGSTQGHPPETVTAALNRYTAGETMGAIASSMNLNRQTVRGWVIRAGLHQAAS